MASALKRNKTIGEINITPLTDVFLVLLVIVIITAPAMSRARAGIAAPEVNQAVVLKSSWLVADVDKEGKIYIEGTLIEAATLREFLAARVGRLPEKVIVVRGDRATQSGVILDVLRAAKDSGFTEGFIAGQVTRIKTAPEPL